MPELFFVFVATTVDVIQCQYTNFGDPTAKALFSSIGREGFMF
jgi:hypothetical protein